MTRKKIGLDKLSLLGLREEQPCGNDTDKTTNL